MNQAAPKTSFTKAGKAKEDLWKDKIKEIYVSHRKRVCFYSFCNHIMPLF